MNNTKKILVILAIVFALGDLAWKIYYVVNYFMAPIQNRPSMVYVVFGFIEIFAIIGEMTLLSMAIWGNGKYFSQRYNLYISAFMIAVIINLLSISTALLVASLFVSNTVLIKDKEEPQVEIIEESKEDKIKKLREKLERGEMSQEEFEKEIMELL